MGQVIGAAFIPKLRVLLPLIHQPVNVHILAFVMLKAAVKGIADAAVQKVKGSLVFAVSRRFRIGSNQCDLVIFLGPFSKGVKHIPNVREEEQLIVWKSRVALK